MATTRVAVLLGTSLILGCTAPDSTTIMEQSAAPPSWSCASPEQSGNRLEAAPIELLVAMHRYAVAIAAADYESVLEAERTPERMAKLGN